MKEQTIEYLESVIKAHGIRKCEGCGEYALPSDDPGGGMGGIQARSMGKDSQGRTMHAKCAMNRQR